MNTWFSQTRDVLEDPMSVPHVIYNQQNATLNTNCFTNDIQAQVYEGVPTREKKKRISRKCFSQRIGMSRGKSTTIIDRHARFISGNGTGHLESPKGMEKNHRLGSSEIRR